MWEVLCSSAEDALKYHTGISAVSNVLVPIASSSWARLGAPSAVLSRGGVALLGLVCVVVTCPKSPC